MNQQEIRFCSGADGVRLAYATVGEGYPIVKAANWLSHLEADWQSPVWGHLYRDLAPNTSSSDTTSAARDCLTAKLSTCPLKTGSMISRPSSTPSDSNGSLCSAFRRADRSRSPTRCSTRSA